MSPVASRFYAIARRLHPELSGSLLRKAAEAFAKRHPGLIDPTPEHVSAAIIAHVRHTRTDYNNRWRRDMERYRDIKAVGNAVAATIIDTRFVRRPLPKVAAPRRPPSLLPSTWAPSWTPPSTTRTHEQNHQGRTGGHAERPRLRTPAQRRPDRHRA